MLLINSAACKYCNTYICTTTFFFFFFLLYIEWLKWIKAILMIKENSCSFHLMGINTFILNSVNRIDKTGRVWAAFMFPPSLLPCAAPHWETFKCTSVGWNLLCVWHPINKKAREGCVNCCHVFSPGIPINHPTNCNKLFADIKLWFWTGEYSSTLQQPPPIKHRAHF